MNKTMVGIGVLILIIGAFFAGKVADSIFSPQKGTEFRDIKMSINESQYHEMERFVISVSDQSYARYLVLDLVLVIPPNINNKLYAADVTPLLRNVLVKQFANMSHADVKALFKNIDTVQKLLLKQFNLVLINKTPLRLDNVLITNVFIQ